MSTRICLTRLTFALAVLIFSIYQRTTTTCVMQTKTKLYGGSDLLWLESVFLLQHLLSQLDRGCSQWRPHILHLQHMRPHILHLQYMRKQSKVV